MTGIVIGGLLLVVGFLMLDHNRQFAMPRSLDIPPAICILFGLGAVVAGVFQIA